MTAIEMMEELAATLRARGDTDQADFLQGVCDALYGQDPADTEIEAYTTGFNAASTSGYVV